MIILDSINKSLEAILSGVITTNQLVYNVSYVDVTPTTYIPGSSDGLTNSVTAVTIAAAPAASTQRQIKLITIFNNDTVAAIVTIRLNNTGTFRILVKVTLAVGSTLVYTDGEGWRVIDSNGSILNNRTNVLLDGTIHSDTVVNAASRGSLIYGNSTPKWDELVIGSTGKVLWSDGTDLSWTGTPVIATSLSVPSIIAPAALTITPVGNVNINSSGTELTFTATGFQKYIRLIGTATSDEVAHRFGDGTTNWYVGMMGTGTGTAGAFTFYQSGVKVTILSGGNVGIGTESPSTRLHIKSADNVTNTTLQIDTIQANINGSDKWVSFTSNSGEEANVVGTGVLGVVAYNTFTGAHKTIVDEPEPDMLMLLEMTGNRLSKQDFLSRHTVEKGPAPKEFLPYTRICITKGSRACFGVYAGKDSYDMAMALAIGTGWIMVVNTGSNLRPGDYLISSNTPGHTEKQLDDVKRASTVASVSESIVWGISETTRKVACRYLMG